MIIILPIFCLILFASFTELEVFNDFHSNSVLAIFSLLSVFIIVPKSAVNSSITNIDNKIGKYVLKTIRKFSTKELFILIVILNVIVNLIGLYYVEGKINYGDISTNFDLPRLRLLLIVSSVFTIAIAQIGGFFLQAMLVYCLAILFEIKITRSQLLSILSISYFGFLLSGIFAVTASLFLIQEHLISFTDIGNLVKDNFILQIVGKSGEYITLSSLAIFIFSLDKNSFRNAILVSFLPSGLILCLTIIF